MQLCAEVVAAVVVGVVVVVELLEEEVAVKASHRTHVPFTLKTIQDGRRQDILIYPHSIRARSTGPGEKVVISVESQIPAHGESLLHPKPIIEVPTSLLLLLTKNLFIVCYTRRIKKYMKLL